MPATHDGHPMDVIAPGASFDYAYPNDQDAAFLWYHDHAHGRTARTLYYGLVGTLPARGRARGASSTSRAASTTCRSCSPTTRSTATARSATRRTSTSASAATRSSSTARSPPRMRVERRIYRLRFLNASNARSYELRLGQRPRRWSRSRATAGCSSAPVAARRVPLHPAERVELLVDFRELPRRLGDRAAERCAGEATTQAVMRFDVVRGGGSEEARIPRGRMRTLERAARRRTRAGAGTSALATDTSGVQWQIAGARLRPDADRRAPAARDHGAVAVAQPVQPRAPDAPARDAVPDRRAQHRASCIPASAAGRTRSACCRARRSPCSRGSCPTRAATCSTATRSSTATRR